jgi:hypothetical protein
MQSSTYRQASRELLNQATRELANGDPRQASEKGWGAAAQIVKAVAAQRGLEHQSHPSLYDVAHILARETRDREISTLFHTAGDLHKNFYENWFSSAVVENGLEDVRRLVDKLEPLLDQ